MSKVSSYLQCNQLTINIILLYSPDSIPSLAKTEDALEQPNPIPHRSVLRSGADKVHAASYGGGNQMVWER